MTLGAIITEIERTVKKEIYSVGRVGDVQQNGPNRGNDGSSCVIFVCGDARGV